MALTSVAKGTPRKEELLQNILHQINKKKENSIISTLNPYKIKLDNNEEILNIKKIPKQEISQLIKETKNEMQRMAKSLNFIEAAKLRDKLFKLKEILK